jgi:hypothetical protein
VLIRGRASAILAGDGNPLVQQYAVVWGTIVAASQVVQVVKEYLPYKNRLKALAGLSVELNALSLLAEDQWFKVGNGRVYDDDVHDLRIALKKKKAAAVQKAFPVAGLPENEKLADKAELDNVQYFSSYL